MDQRTANDRLDWLDYGRFIAALAVMCFHYLHNGVRRDNISSITHFEPLAAFAKYGNLGVNFFFIISGFVIFYSAIDRSPQKFLADRCVRLLPAFLFCMSLTTLVRIFLGAPHFEVSLTQYLANLTMMPKKFGQEAIDGVYWTLYLEIVFYFAVFILIATNALKKPQIVIEVWVAALVAYTLLGKNFPALGGYAAYFAAGTLFAIIQRNGITLRLAIALIITFSLALHDAVVRAEMTSIRHDTEFSPFVAAGITAGFFCVFLLFTTTKLRNLKLPASAFIGGLTYPLYLLHAYIGYILLSRFGSDEFKWVSVTVMMTAALAGSAFVLIVIERKPRAFYRKAASHLIEHPLERLIRAASNWPKKKATDVA